MDWLSSNVRQSKNYMKLFGTRAYALGTKYINHGKSSFSTPRVPHTTPNKPPSLWKNFTNTIKAFCMEPTCIVDSDTLTIFVGSAFNTASASTYSKTNITHIINCADKEDMLPIFYQEYIEAYYSISLRDEDDEDASFVEDSRFHEGLLNFLSNIFNKKRDASHKVNLLVHCVFGRSRSVAICIIILFLFNQYNNTPKSIIQCYEYIGKKRKVIALQRRFLIELTAFQHKFEKDIVFKQKWMSIFE
jgi:predicted protein tyrosine phosphatase